MDLHLHQLTKRFGDRLAVEVPGLTIRHGEFFTFVGPSGCGKSTLLNLIAGLEEPTTGTIRAGDRVLNGLAPHRRNVAFVFQTYALYPHRTAFENIAFPLELAGVSREEIRERVQEVAQVLGLEPLLRKRPRQLSGGERQRVALGRAIVRRPEFSLFDEPLSNLDAPLRAQMRRELKALHTRLGTTFIYVTHDQDEALSMSSRIAVLRAGRIEQCAPPEAIYARPASRFVASFFGSPPMNLLDAGTVDADQTVAVGDLRWRLRGAVPPNVPVTLGIRPEDVQVMSADLMTSEGQRRHHRSGSAVEAEVVRVELHGGQTHIELELAGSRLLAFQHGGAGIQIGDRLAVAVAPEQLHVFGPDGRRLEVRGEAA